MFLPVLSSLVGHIGLATWDQKKKMEHRTIFIGTVFIIRAFMDLLRTNICSLLTCKSHLLNIVFYIFEIIPLSKIWSVFKSIVGICLQEYNAHD